MGRGGAGDATLSGEAAEADAPGRSLRKVYVEHPPEVWVRARARYLAGRTAGQVAAELGCSISAVRLQAARGGWTRRDAAAAGGGGDPVAGAAAKGGAGGGGAAPLGEGRFDPPLSPSAREDGRVAHLRLTPQAWEVIRGERLAGASIAALARKWNVSEGTLRRHASDEGWSNTDRGEAVSRAMVEEKIAQDAFADGRAAAEREAAERAGAEAALTDALGAEAEADPLEAARTLLRRAAASAVAGRLAQAGAGVKLAEGLARAAAALGLVAEADDGWEDEDEEPRLSPEALEALRDDVERRYARFDREPEGGEAGAARTEAGDAPAWPPPAASVDGEAGEGEGKPGPGPGRSPVPWPPSPPRRGISRASQAISVSPWPAWAGPPDVWPRSAWSR